MELLINNDNIKIPDEIGNVSTLLEHLQLDKLIVIVEVNGVILEKTNHRDTRLSDGDKIEIVHFVGGG